ncbi:hypothetical protein [Larkinella knui]|nr:hypothetical protein [Larkinella knui]
MSQLFYKLLFTLVVLMIPIPIALCDFNSIALPGGMLGSPELPS